MSRFSAEEQHAIEKILQDDPILNNINDQNKAAQNFSAAKLVELSKNHDFLQAVAKNRELIEAIGNNLFKNLPSDPSIVLHNTQSKPWGTGHTSTHSIDSITKNRDMAIRLLGSRNTAPIPSRDAIAELLPAIVRKATEEDKIRIIDDVAAELNFKLGEEFDWINPSELSEHMLKNVYASNTIKQWSFGARLY
jgi:hypothetical protein